MHGERSAARVRRRVAQAAWRAALGPVSGRAPRNVCRSIVGAEGRRLPDANVLGCELLSVAHVERYAFEPELPASFRRSKAFDDRYLYRLAGVCASARTGLVWLPRRAILAESVTGSVVRLMVWGDEALEAPLLRVRRRIEGPVVVLPTHSYAHWLLEDLPAALHALQRTPGATLLVPRSAPRYLEEAVELLGPARVERCDEPVLAEELVLTARSQFYAPVPREDVEVLRRVLRPRVGRGSEEALYVSRRHDPRAPDNEAELERALARVGFQIVTAQRLPFAEQIERFAGARLLAGPHGAGLANLVWADAPAALTEVFVWQFNDLFARLAVSLGAAYHPFPGSGIATSREVPVAAFARAARRTAARSTDGR